MSSLIYTLVLVSFLSILSFSQMAPFYPLQAKEKGVSVFMVGFVLGSNALTYMASCIWGGMYLHKIGRENAIVVGLLLIFLQQTGLYMLSSFKNPTPFLICSFAAQLIGGLGSGINAVASMAMVVSGSKASEREQNIGLVEAATGVGFLLGPIWGSMMYQIGGYSAPFGSTALFYLICYPFCAYVLIKARDRRLAKEASLSQHLESNSSRDGGSQEASQKNDEIELMHLLCIARFFFGLCSQVLVSSSIQFMAPAFSVHMTKYGFSPAFIGICFAVPGIIYAALSPLMYLFTERLPKRAVILIGILLMSVGMFLVGTSKSLGLENNPAMIILGLMVIGAAAGMISIPVLPEMLESIDERNDRKYNLEELNNYISGIFVTSNGLGEFIGPVLSSFLNDRYGFREAQDIYANIILVFALIYFLCVGHIYIFIKTDKERSNTRQVPAKHVELEETIEVEKLDT